MTTKALPETSEQNRRRLILFLIAAIPVSWILLSLVSLPLLNEEIGDPCLLLPLWRIFAAFTIGPWVVVKNVLVIGMGVGLVAGLTVFLLGGLGIMLLVFWLPSILGGVVKGVTMGGMISQPIQHARSHGRLTDEEIAQARGLQGAGLPLCYTLSGQLIGIPYGEDSGHVAVLGPTRSGKGLHLTETLFDWKGPALVIDPKGEQLARTCREVLSNVG